MSDNWVVQNLQNALDTWNKYLTEIWQLIAQSPAEFKGGAIWGVILNIHDAIRAVGLALLVLFFLVGVMRTCGSFAEMRRPEVALKLFVRFALAKGVVTYGLELMLALFDIIQGWCPPFSTPPAWGLPRTWVAAPGGDRHGGGGVRLL